MGKKKACEYGKRCPYRHEHQHNMEYHHNSPATAKPDDMAEMTGTFQPFGGVGQSLASRGGGGGGGMPGEGGGAAGGAAGAGGGDAFAEYGGIDPNMDPELAMAL
eukprot:CAMPEP_0178512430 /NCGR_PEP_ID=MMETSP0696-20121128/22885_1 /TAXON_ID=265572 /ORGANISM="Extubocellulus spinifer, Strain CCMP396" /LENGTH=104 /DNA_ID=CAMNT_0020142257 /DNA_START=214 /DNA_END=525 /DNA_ORIENTATION=+